MEGRQIHVVRPEFDCNEILNGWKEIANYMGKGVRTVQRYEMQLGLPVHRPAGKAKGSVLTTRAELDAWIAASPIRESFGPTRSAQPALPGLEAAANLRQGLANLHTLRDEMSGLRSDLARSLQKLQQNLDILRQQQWGIEALSRLTVIEEHFRNPQVIGLLHQADHNRRAS